LLLDGERKPNENEMGKESDEPIHCDAVSEKVVDIAEPLRGKIIKFPDVGGL
jgi:hypothetical protein